MQLHIDIHFITPSSGVVYLDCGISGARKHIAPVEGWQASCQVLEKQSRLRVSVRVREIQFGTSGHITLVLISYTPTAEGAASPTVKPHYKLDNGIHFHSCAIFPKYFG